jgi:hypothetical protein
VRTKFDILVLISAPGLPANVSVVSVTSSSIAISWTAPENIGGGITNYVIHYMSIVDDNNDAKGCNNTIMPTEQMDATQNNATTILLKNLQAWTLYQINVTANSSYGEGPTAVLTSRTDESGLPILFADIQFYIHAYNYRVG